VLTDEERAVLSGLVADSRTPTAELGRPYRPEPRRVRDLVRDLLSSRRVVLRTKLQADASGWPICAWFFLHVPAATAATISPRLGSLPEIRTALQIVGPSNMIMAVSL
jgi:hypothetical protein